MIYQESILKLKAFESLKNNAFYINKLKKQNNYRALRFWSKKISRKVIYTLKAY